jgi:hypothetical protein
VAWYSAKHRDKYCETWSLTSGDEHRLRLFQNGMLRRIFRPEGKEVKIGRKRLHIKELRDL